jgi:hypothetical protein
LRWFLSPIYFEIVDDDPALCLALQGGLRFALVPQFYVDTARDIGSGTEDLPADCLAVFPVVRPGAVESIDGKVSAKLVLAAGHRPTGVPFRNGD